MLAPFGTDNPSPYFMIKDNKIEQLKQIGASNNHLKYQAVNGEVKLDCIAFNYGEEMSEFSQGESIQQVGQLSINEWNGFRKPQFMLTDYQVSGFQIFDIRGKKGFEVKPVTEAPATGIPLDDNTVNLTVLKASTNCISASIASSAFPSSISYWSTL